MDKLLLHPLLLSPILLLSLHIFGQQPRNNPVLEGQQSPTMPRASQPLFALQAGFTPLSAGLGVLLKPTTGACRDPTQKSVLALELPVPKPLSDSTLPHADSRSTTVYKEKVIVKKVRAFSHLTLVILGIYIFFIFMQIMAIIT